MVSPNTASVYSIVVHAGSGIVAIAFLAALSIRTVTDTAAPPARVSQMMAIPLVTAVEAAGWMR